MSDSRKEFLDKWEEFERFKMATLRNIYLTQKVNAVFLIELRGAHNNKTFKEASQKYDVLYQDLKKKFQDHLFAEYGTIDLKDIFPEEPPPPTEGK